MMFVVPARRSSDQQPHPSELVLWEGPVFPFRARACLERKFALVPAGASKEVVERAARALLFGDKILPDPVTDYGPLASRQPRRNRQQNEAQLAPVLQGFLQALNDGQNFWAPTMSIQLQAARGPFQPQGELTAFAYGGAGIDLSHGEEQCPSAVALAGLLHQATMDRMFICAFDADTGAVVDASEWDRPPQPTLLKGQQGLEGELELPAFLVGDYYSARYKVLNPVEQDGALEEAIWEARSHDGAHAIRACANAIQATEYLDDPLAREDLCMMAAHYRCGAMSARTDERVEATASESYVPDSLTKRLHDQRSSKTLQHLGTDVDRTLGHCAYLAACGIKWGSAQQRQACVDWTAAALEYAQLVQMPSGIMLCAHDSGYMPLNEDCTLVFHCWIQLWGLFAAELQARRASRLTPEFRLGRVPSATQTLLLGHLAALLTPACRAPADAATFGVRHWIVSRRNGYLVPADELGAGYGDGDPAHIWTACALAYRCTGEAHWLKLALPYFVPHATLEERLAWCQAQPADTPWTAEMQACLEQLLPSAAGG